MVSSSWTGDPTADVLADPVNYSPSKSIGGKIGLNDYSMS